jgi:hypothetical protein
LHIGLEKLRVNFSLAGLERRNVGIFSSHACFVAAQLRSFRYCDFLRRGAGMGAPRWQAQSRDENTLHKKCS